MNCNLVAGGGFEISWELSEHDSDTKWANAMGTMTLIDLLVAGLPQTFNLWKIKDLETQYNETCLYSKSDGLSLPRLGYSKTVASGVSVASPSGPLIYLSLWEKPSDMSWGSLLEPTCPLRFTWVSLEANSFQVVPWDDCSSGWHLDCSFVRDHEVSTIYVCVLSH